MKRRILAWAMALAMLLGLLPAVSLPASAAGDLPDLVNVKVSAEGVITWDAYPGATGYNYVVDGPEVMTGWTIDDLPELDLGKSLKDSYAPSGSYQVHIEADDGSYNDIASIDITYEHVGLDPLPAPANLRWDGYTARWDPVEGATNGYYLYIFKTDPEEYVYSTYVGGTSYDARSSLADKESSYSFRVRTYGSPSGSKSDYAQCPVPTSGRFTRGDLNISLNGDYISWPPYVDTEGNDAWYYYVEQYSNPWFISNEFYGTGINLRRVLELEDAPDGTYVYRFIAKSRDGLDVSLQSNQVTYEYTRRERTAVKMTGYETKGGYLNNLCLYGSNVYSYEEHTCTVGAQVSVLAVPYEHFMVKSLLVCYGGEEYETGEIAAQGNGTFYGSFPVPDQDFTLKVVLDYDYQELAEVSASFSEAPGQEIGSLKIEGDENCTAYRGTVLSSNLYLTNGDFLLPGDSVHMIVRLTPKQYYHLLTMDTRVKINGKDVEVLEVNEGGHEMYCAYDFTVPEEDFTLVSSSSWDPIPNLKVSDDGIATWDAFPGAAIYYIGGSQYVSDDVEECSFDLGAELKRHHAPSGWYVLYLQAQSEEWYVLGESYIAWYYSGEEALSVPQNLRWDGYTARWDPVEGAESYQVRFFRYPGAYGETDINVKDTFYDFSTDAEMKQYRYVFRVMARAGEGRADSLFSPLSGTKQGRFEYGALNVSLDGDILRWEEYTDTEGNPAAYYVFNAYDGPAYIYTYLTGTSMDLHELMELLDKPEGEYKSYLIAYSADGCQVSEGSGEFIYNYTADTRTTVPLKYWSTTKGNMDEVRINSVQLDNYQNTPLTAGRDYTLSVRTREHYVLEDIALEYGDEEHSDGVTGLKRQPDGSYTCTLHVPDQEFILRFHTQWDWEEVGSVQISFPETPGIRTNELDAKDPDGAFWIELRDRNCSDSDSVYGKDYLLPGQKWQTVFSVTPKLQYQRFGGETAVTINGKKAEVVKMSEDSRTLYVRYDFETAPAASVDLEPYNPYGPCIEGMKVSAAGVITWNPFPGADHYYVYYDDRYRGGNQTECTFDLRTALEDENAPGGWYQFVVQAEDSESMNIAHGAIAWYYDGPEAMTAPANLRWEGNTAVWDPVEGAEWYNLQVMDVGGIYCTLNRTIRETSYDLSTTVLYQDRSYAFRVKASGEEAPESFWSPLSTARPGRFRLEDLPVTLEGDMLTWPEYIDTEGNPAAYYVISQYSNPAQFSNVFYGTSLNLRKALERAGAPDGDYTFCVTAVEKDGYDVSNYSEDVVYHYTAVPRPAVHVTTEFSYSCELLIDGSKFWNNDECTMATGEEVQLEIRPKDRYRISGAYMVFGEDDRKEISLTEGADGVCTGSFTVPDRDFTLRVETERVYEMLHSLRADFSEEPGYLLAMIEITPEEATDWNAWIDGLTGPHGAGNANLRPGGEYEAVIDFRMYGDDCRFADDITAEINGTTCTPESVTPTEVRVRYRFTVSSELSSIIVRGVTAPALEEQPGTGQGVPGGVFYYIVNESSVSKRWYYNDGSWKWMTEGEEFRPDIAYILQLEYAASDECVWADDVGVTVEDVDPERIESITVLKSGEPAGSRRTVEIRFRPLKAPEAVTTAGCTVKAPQTGDHPDMNPVALDTEKYTVKLTGWYWDMQPGVKMTSASTFASGGRYCLRVEFQPKEGYFFTEDTVFTINGTATDSRYASDYGQVQIDLVAADPLPDGPEDFQFDDVKDSSKFYYDPVYWAFKAEPQVTNGIDDKHFGPDRSCTRGQVVTFLWRAAGCPEPAKTDTGFKDLKAGGFYVKAVAWAVENGITNGLSADKFGPDATCTRGQIVTFLWRFKGMPDPVKTDTGFKDLKAGGFYLKAVAWAVENNITNGMSADRFAPDATCTRGQVVTFLYRATKD